MTLQRGRVVLPAAALGAVGALVVTPAALHQHYRAPAGTAIAVGVVRALAVGLCLLRPVTSLVAVVAAGVVTTVVTTPTGDAEPWPWSVSSVIVLAAVLVLAGAAWPAGRRGLRAVVTGAVVVANGGAALAMLARDGRLDGGRLFVALVLTAAAALVADLLAARRRVGGELVEQRATTEAEVAARLQGEERARIARELHDVVAHHLSVVVVRADSAPRRLGGLDDATAAEFRAIGDDARQSLDEMRRVLRLLRPAATGGSAVTPQPKLSDAAELVADARAAGADVRLDATLPDVRGVAGLVAYRTLQEAITNALRHAPGATVTVSAVERGGSLRLTVENATGRAGAADGHGLTGMRERIAGAGGTVTAGTTGAGTFLVRADLPVGTPS